MATQEDILYAEKLLHDNSPHKIFNSVNQQNFGTLAVLKYLYDATDEVNSVDISNFICISSARVTVLIKKLEQRGLLTKTNSSTDARVKIIKLTDKGHAIAKKHRERMFATTGEILDTFGLEEFEKLMHNTCILKEIITKNKLDAMEDFDD